MCPKLNGGSAGTPYEITFDPTRPYQLGRRAQYQKVGTTQVNGSEQCQGAIVLLVVIIIKAIMSVMPDKCLGFTHMWRGVAEVCEGLHRFLQHLTSKSAAAARTPARD